MAENVYLILQYVKMPIYTKILDFKGKFLRNSLFKPKNEPKGPYEPIETTWDNEKYFSEMPAYKKPIVEQRIFKLSRIEKKLV